MPFKLYWDPPEGPTAEGTGLRFRIDHDGKWFRLRDRAGHFKGKAPFKTFGAAVRAAESQLNSEAEYVPRRRG